jgi:hypothetical protein
MTDHLVTLADCPEARSVHGSRKAVYRQRLPQEDERPASNSSSQRLVAPRIPTWTWRSSSIDLDLRQRREILFQHFEEAFRLG